MKVQNFYEPLVMKYEEHDIPQIADNEILIKVMACSICGSDVSYYYGHSRWAPRTAKARCIWDMR